MAANPGRGIPFGIKDTNSGTTNSLSKLLEDQKFDYNITKYPLNLGGEGQGVSHYIVFHILEQRKSQYKTDQVTGVDAGESAIGNERDNARIIDVNGAPAQRLAAEGVDAISPFVSRVFTGITNSLADTNTNNRDFTASDAVDLVGEVGGQFATTVRDANKLGFLRTVTKTSETIALYMPDTLNFVQPQGYADLEMGNNMVTALFAGGSAVADSIRAYTSGGSKEAFKSSLTRNLSPFLINALGDKLGNFGKAVAAAGQGIVTNPMIEVLYTSPGLRSFRFDFMFYPESQKEAFAVQKIIQLFQFHQAPEIAPGTGGYFLVPPSEFDIEFYYNGKENINLPVISTCVLTSVDVDYAPNGWTAYEISGEDARIGGSGMPVATKLSLEFKETSIVTKASRQFDKAPINKSSTITATDSTSLRARQNQLAGN
jgi:hypothetical protein